MGIFRRLWSREPGVAASLRAGRPAPSEELIEKIVASRPEPSRAPAPGRLRVAVVSAAVVVGLLAIGGIGFAANYAGQIISTITNVVVTKHTGTLRVVGNSPAADQYATTTSATTTAATTTAATTTTTTTATTTAAATTTVTSTATSTTTQTVTTASGEVTAPVSAGSPGEISTQAPGSTTPVSVTWGATSFTTPVTIAVNPAATPGSGTSFQGAGNTLVSVTVTSNGQTVHQLAAPIDIVFTNPPAGFVPAYSADGNPPFISVPPLDPGVTTLPEGQPDGYYKDASGNIHLLTRHVTVFAVLFKANLNVSESGRKFQPAGSGKFGDPTRIHAGAPRFSWIAKPAASGNTITYTFFVDEQIALYVNATSSTNEVTISSASTVRAHPIGGPSRKSLHIVILRPGTIRMVLRLPSLASASGTTVNLTGVDYDGHRVTLSATAK